MAPRRTDDPVGSNYRLSGEGIDGALAVLDQTSDELAERLGGSRLSEMA